MTKLTPEKIELATLTRENGKTQIKILPADQVDELIKKYEKVEAELEAAKKEKEKAQAQKPWSNSYVFIFVLKRGLKHVKLEYTQHFNFKISD